MKKLLLLTLFTLSLTTQLYAAGIGRIVKLHGDAYKVNLTSKIKKKLKLGDFIQAKDQVVTVQRTIVKVLMNDDTVLLIGPNSEFEFNKFKMKTKNDREAEYNLNYGQLRSLFVRKAPKRTIKIKARNVSMGIRGTEILTNVFKDAQNQYQSDIVLLSGSLDVTFNAPKIGSNTVNIKPGTEFSTYQLMEQNSKNMKLGLGKADQQVMQMVKSNKDSIKSFLPIQEKVRNQENHNLEIQKIRDNYNNSLSKVAPAKSKETLSNSQDIAARKVLDTGLVNSGEEKNLQLNKRKIIRQKIRPALGTIPSRTTDLNTTALPSTSTSTTLLPTDSTTLIVKDPSLTTTTLLPPPDDSTIIVKDPTLTTTTLLPPPDDSTLIIKDPTLTTTTLPPPPDDSTLIIKDPTLTTTTLPPPPDDSTLIIKDPTLINTTTLPPPPDSTTTLDPTTTTTIIKR